MSLLKLLVRAISLFTSAVLHVGTGGPVALKFFGVVDRNVTPKDDVLSSNLHSYKSIIKRV
jgi:hypothetical protein